eukprot:scaffold83855_cov34-Prasinocladus_malaysianus.AAC.1
MFLIVPTTKKDITYISPKQQSPCTLEGGVLPFAPAVGVVPAGPVPPAQNARGLVPGWHPGHPLAAGLLLHSVVPHCRPPGDPTLQATVKRNSTSTA